MCAGKTADVFFFFFFCYFRRKKQPQNEGDKKLKISAEMTQSFRRLRFAKAN